MANKKKEVKGEAKEIENEQSSLRRSSRSTRGSVKPVVDLSKVDKAMEEAVETRPKKSRKNTKSDVKRDPDEDIVDLVDLSDNDADEASDEIQIIEDADQEDNESDDDRNDDDSDDVGSENDDDDDADFEEPRSKHISRTRRQSGATKRQSLKSAPTTKRATKKKENPANSKKPQAKSVKNDKNSHVRNKSDEIEVLYQLSEKEMKEINQAFDVNCAAGSDETIGPEDLKAAIRSLGFEPRADEIQKLIGKFSTRHGKINRDGFHKIMAFKIGSVPGKNDKAPNDEISKVFSLLDLDKTGVITMENLRSLAKELNEDITDEELYEMITEADLDGDLKINKQEFYNIMKKTSLY